MTEPAGKSMLRTAALAIVAGALAGAALLYVRGGLESNQQATSPAAAPAVADAGDCPADNPSAAAVKANRGGEVAAMLPASGPVSLADTGFIAADGSPRTLGDMKGKVLLVNLWATWCAPCREEMPALDRLQSARGGDDFEVVTVNIDTGGHEKAQAFLDEIGVKNLALNADHTMGIFNDLKKRSLAFGLPVTLLVDRQSCLAGSMNGPAVWDGPDALKLIDAVTGAAVSG